MPNRNGYILGGDDHPSRAKQQNRSYDGPSAGSIRGQCEKSRPALRRLRRSNRSTANSNKPNILIALY